MTREEINLLTSADLKYIGSIPLDSHLNVYNKNICSHTFLYKFYLIRVEMEKNNINNIFITNNNMKTEYIFSSSNVKYNYSFGYDCKRENIDDIKDFLFEVILLIKNTTLFLDYDGKKIDTFFKKVVRKEKIRKLLEDNNNKS